MSPPGLGRAFHDVGKKMMVAGNYIDALPPDRRELLLESADMKARIAAAHAAADALLAHLESNWFRAGRPTRRLGGKNA